jgi:hypothetical protein
MIGKSKIAAAAAVLLTGALIAMAGCAPDSGYDNISDYDVVVTHYDPDADFNSFTTFAVADTLLELGDPDGEETDLPAGLKSLIIDEVEDQMIRCGYTLESDPETNDPDLVLVAGVTQTSWTGYTPGYPWYPPDYGWGPWYPWYPWYGKSSENADWYWYPSYPWYPNNGYVTSYSVGTLIMMMQDMTDIDQGTDSIPVVWLGSVNGLLGDNSNDVKNRLEYNINEALKQSPYLDNE